MSKPANLVPSPCCQAQVAVTHRKSKLSERPRNHTCPKCGQPFKVGANLKPVQ